MKNGQYEVGDAVDLDPRNINSVDLRGQGITNRVINRIRYNNLTHDIEGVYFDGDPDSWGPGWIKGLSEVQESESRPVAAQDRVKLKFNRNTGTVISVVEFGMHEGKAVVQWDKTDAVEAVNAGNLVVLHAPTDTIEVDDELVSRLNAERQRLLRIIEATTKELRPLTEQWKKAKSGKVIG